MPIFSNRNVAHGLLDRFYLFNKSRQISSKTTVAQSVLTPISSNRTVAHGVLHKV